MSWVLDQSEVHMTVGSSVQMADKRPSMQNDMQMVKAALLYADRAKLVSLTSSALLQFRTVAELPESERLPFLKEHPHWIKDEKLQRQILKLVELFERSKKRRYSKRGREALNQVRAVVEEIWRDRQHNVEAMVSELGAQGLFEAERLGLLEVHNFETLLDRVAKREVSNAALTLDYINAVSPAVTDSQTYPLFDEVTGGLIKQRVTAGDIKIGAKEMVRGKEVALAGDLLARLPLFERASISEVLDIRRELEKPLRQFRSAMVRFSSEIESAPWEKDFAQDAEGVFRREITPAVLELEDEEKSNSFLAELTAKVADKSLQLGGAISASGAISALAVRMLNVPLADVAALAVGPAIMAGGVAYSAYKEWKEKQKETEGNSLFFYYKAGSLLEDGSFRYEDANVQS